MTWRGIVGKSFTPDGFEQYIATLQFGLWRPRFVVVHNTSAPDLKTWSGWQARKPPITDERWAQNLVPQTAAFPFDPIIEPFEPWMIDFWSIAGNEFLQEAKIDRRCVVLTGVPSPNYRGIGLAKGMAEKLDLTLINVIVHNMATMDHAHLNAETAEHWSKAFLDRAGPLIDRCISR